MSDHLFTGIMISNSRFDRYPERYPAVLADYRGCVYLVTNGKQVGDGLVYSTTANKSEALRLWRKFAGAKRGERPRYFKEGRSIRGPLIECDEKGNRIALEPTEGRPDV